MSPAQARMATAARLDAERNRQAIAESRLACLKPAARSLASVLVEGWEFEVAEPSRVRPYVLREAS